MPGAIARFDLLRGLVPRLTRNLPQVHRSSMLERLNPNSRIAMSECVQPRPGDTGAFPKSVQQPVDVVEHRLLFVAVGREEQGAESVGLFAL